MDLIQFLIFYFIILFSIIGYGNLLSKLIKIKFDISELGFAGLLILILISYVSNLIFSHSFTHNLLIHFVGLLFFFNLFKKKIYQKGIFLVILISFVLFIGLLMHKTHDDFFYYHFGYTYSLIEYKKIIGLGNLEHGFRTPSSIFYLNSLFYLPIIELSLINSGVIFYMIFSNFFLIKKINYRISNKRLDFILILSILTLLFINTIFYRLAEHGTDRSALILVFILAIYYLEGLNQNKKNTYEIFEYYYNRILIVILLIVSLKSFYLIYYVFIIFFLFEFRKIVFKKENLSRILFNKANILFVCSTLVFISAVFTSSGCLIYPASFTCIETFNWSIPKQEVQDMKSWYELWSKGGANPNSRVLDPDLYISGFNWVSNWIDIHFFNKISDYLLSLFVICATSYFVLKNSRNNFVNKKNYKLFYILLICLLIEWFMNHPALRYGGFTLIALIIFIPLSFLLERYIFLTHNFAKKVNFLIICSFIIFFIKNLDRIINENNKYSYNPFKNPQFFIDEKAFKYDDIISKIRKINNNKFYIVLTKDLVRKLN